MKLSVIGDELSQDHVLVAETAAQLGFDGIEIRSLEETPPHLLTDDQLSRVRAVLDEHGLAVAGFAPPIFKGKIPQTDQEIEAAAEILVASCERAVRLGAPHVRIFSFFLDGEPDPLRAAKVAGSILAGYDVPVPLVVETEGRSNTPTMRHLVSFLDELGRDDVTVLWDPANCVYRGWDPAPFPADYMLGRERIRHVHIKDPAGTREYVRLGDGDLPWPAILTQLSDDGYDGFLSLETHWRHGRPLTEEHRNKPWGESFSAGGYTAGVECMQRLRGWFDQLVAGQP